MKLVITIEFENDAMQTGEDAAEALKKVRAYLSRMDNEDLALACRVMSPYPILDRNGNRVGGWLLSSEE